MTPVLLLQPPFVQLNAPYPAPYYLRSFLAGRGSGSGREVRVADHSIGLFERIFSRTGAERLFADAEAVLAPELATASAESLRADARLANAARCLSQRELWIGTIDRLAAFLRGRDHEFGHLLSAANGALPEGPRLDRLLAGCGGSPAPDDAGRVASALLADLADFATAVLDPTFALVRYAESLAASTRSFAAVEPAVDGYVLDVFYESLLQAEWDAVEAAWAPTADAPFLLGLTLPFPGCLAGALRAGRSAKARFGSRVRVAAGGGYANTELRSISSRSFFDYVDFLAFDRGYGALAAILDRLDAAADPAVPAESSAGPAADADVPLYKTVFRRGDGLIGAADAPAPAPGTADAAYAAIDATAVATVFPDYRGVDFTRYLRPVDDANPMHRLWSDGRWLKAYLAHGCYWHACAFCDVKLDYIRGYAPVDPDALFAHLVAQAAAVGVRGVHLVDEAAPAASLLRLAELNRAAGLPLAFWGNIRFEAHFTPDLAQILAAGGLLGVSAGIEVASDSGFKRLGKGLGLAEVVRACAAFKEAGILVHAYLIYGFWDETDGEIVDSAETMRQLFAAGLADSAFWHKFVLTRHSRINAERERGRHPGLELVERAAAFPADFADNDLAFAGEERAERFTAPLDALLAAWMAGERLEAPVRAAFPFAVPAPTVGADRIARELDAYARERDAGRAAEPEAAGPGTAAVLLGGRPLAVGRRVVGYRRYENWGFAAPDGAAAARIAALLARAGAAGGLDAAELWDGLRAELGEAAARKAWRRLRAAGLALAAGNLPGGRNRPILF
jgi:radical SAM superfamily enzyme YgiQ (UPF0313 family)